MNLDGRSTHSRKLAALLLLAGSSLPVAAQVDGALDNSFWTDGRIVLESPPFEIVLATVVAPDGRLVVVGRRTDPGWEEYLFWRILNDDSLEPACVPNSPGGGTYLTSFAAAFDPQGRLLLAGVGLFGSAGQEGFALRYLYPACDLDEGFHSDGLYRTNLNNAAFLGVAFDSSSRTVLAGTADEADGQNKLLVVRLSEAGLPDPDFGFVGVVELDLAEDVSARAVAVQPDDRIVVGGELESSTSGDDFFLARLDPQGDLDPTFAGDGTVQVDIQVGFNDDLGALVLDPVSGDILAAGNSWFGASSKFAVLRLESNGLPDETFDDDGIWTDSLWTEDSAGSIQLQSDGKILVAGQAVPSGSDDKDFLVYRLLPDGQRDNSFDGNGVVGVSFGLVPFSQDYVYSTALQAGKLVIGGYAAEPGGGGTGTRAIVARLWIGLIFTDGFECGSASAWSSAAGTP